MDFATEPQKATWEKVAQWMKELFGEMAMAREDAPAFSILLGSAFTQVVVNPWGKDDATITVRSYVVQGVEVTQDLMQYLLRENDTMRFGAFGLDSDNDIFFEHAIVGSTADKVELKTSVMAVGVTADRYDDQIMARWGGRRAVDQQPG